MGGRGGGSSIASRAAPITFLPGRYRDPVTLQRGTAEGDLVAAYQRESQGTTALVPLSDLREAPEMKSHSRVDFDRAVRSLADAGHAVAAAEENPRALSPKGRAAAVRIGGQDRHLLAIGRLRGDRGNKPSTIVDGRETFRVFPKRS